MTTITIKIANINQIRAAFLKAPAQMTRNLDTAIRKSVLLIKGESQRNAPVRTGNLRGSAYTTYSPLKGEIGFRANYAAAVHEGSKAHDIRPLNKKALFWKSAEHPVKLVHHPGFRGNPFLRKAVDSSDSQVQRFFVDAVENAMGDIAREAG